MVYDGNRQRIVLFGGCSTLTASFHQCSGSVLADTWEFYDNVWHRMAPQTVPQPRYHHMLGYDALNQKVVLFGGMQQNPGPILGDTWVWDGTNWSQGDVDHYAISGQVTDGSGNPISGVYVSDNVGHHIFTPGNGNYVLNPLLPGTYTVTPAKSGYSFSPPSLSVTVPPNATGQNFTATQLTYSIAGKVTDSSGNPLSGVNVSDNVGHNITTASNGNYVLNPLLPGTYTVTPAKSGYAFSPLTRTVTVPPDATGQDFTATPAPDLTVAYIEINQAVQDRQNSVALVAHKPTVVRAYADIGSQVTSVDHITATLKVRRGATVLDTIQGRGEITAHQNPKPERVYDSLNFFLLNTDYLTGTLDFEVTLNPAHVVPESNYTNNAKSQPGTFQEQRAVLIRYVPIHYAPPGYTGPMEPGRPYCPRRRVSQVDYPLAPSNVDYRPLQVITFTLPVNQGSNDSTLLAELGDLWQECNCDYVYGWLPPSVYSGNGLGQRPGHVAFGNDTDGRWRRTFAHELGHNLGSDHTQGQGGDAQAPDTLAADQEFGFNVSGQEVKYRRPDGGLLRDVMFAGEVEANAWVTPYFWRAAFTKFKAPAATMAAQTAGEYLLASGFILREGGGSLRPLFRTTRTSSPPSLQGSEYCLSQQDAVGQNLASDCFDVYFDADSGSNPPDTMPFHVAVPWISGTARVVLLHGTTVLDEQMVSTHSPTVQVLTPMAVAR